jgi:hypothetical protein
VLELIAETAVCVVGAVVGSHLPEDFQPAHRQAAEGGGVFHALPALLPVVRVGPRRLNPAAVGPQVQRGTQVHIARPAYHHEPAAARLLGDGRGPGVTPQRLVAFEDFPVGTHFGRQARGDSFARAGQ